jgi:hypothetical protein
MVADFKQWVLGQCPRRSRICLDPACIQEERGGRTRPVEGIDQCLIHTVSAAAAAAATRKPKISLSRREARSIFRIGGGHSSWSAGNHPNG